jgi:ribonuclease-3
VALATTTDHGRLVELLGVKPLPEDLLDQALTHASYINEADSSAISNERLEFLGDSVLGMVIASILFEQFPDAGEGDLTRMRAEIVRGTSLARVAERLGLGEHIILGRGEESAGGRARDRNLAGALEALVGAVYEAHGYRAAKGLTRRLLKPELEQIHRHGARVDAKSSLQHLVQARWHEPPGYVTVQEAAGAQHRFIVEVRVAGNTLGRGEGKSKREAQQAAAREAVLALTSHPKVEG